MSWYLRHLSNHLRGVVHDDDHYQTPPTAHDGGVVIHRRTMEKDRHVSAHEGTEKTNSKCPVMHGEMKKAGLDRARKNRDWWPDQLDLKILHQHQPASDPLAPDLDYREAFKKLDYKALKADLTKLMTDSQEWWPADF